MFNKTLYAPSHRESIPKRRRRIAPIIPLHAVTPIAKRTLKGNKQPILPEDPPRLSEAHEPTSPYGATKEPPQHPDLSLAEQILEEKDIARKRHPSEKRLEAIVEEGQEEAIKEMIKSEEQNLRKVEELVSQHPRILYHIKTVFPFDLFPDEISIEDTKVNFKINTFFGTTSVQSVGIKDIYDITVDASIFFAKFKITSRVFVEGQIEVSFLKRPEAFRARRLLEGLRALDQQGVDINLLDVKDIIDKIEDIGRIKT